MVNRRFIKMMSIVTGSVVVLSIIFYIVCFPVAILIDFLYAAFIVFNILLDRYCRKLIERGNEEVEAFAKKEGYNVKHISLSEYERLTKKDGIDLGDETYVSKEVLKYI